MGVSVESLFAISDIELVTAYHDARRRHVEERFKRDSERARLEWQKAKLFLASSGGVTERQYMLTASEELARKGQELRELSRDLDLLKAEVDVIGMVMRMRGGPLPAGESETEIEAESEEA
jgi:hypothetical protein